MPPTADADPLSISIVIPTCNSARFIGRAVASVARQTVRPVEVIVVDDASTDATCDLVMELAERHRSEVTVRLLRLERNSGGPALPTNVGLRASVGRFMTLLDHDDVLLPRKLERQRSALTAAPEAGVSFGNYLSILPGGDRYARPAWTIRRELRLRGHRRAGVFLVPPRLLTEQHVAVPGFIQSATNLMFRREIWETYGPFDESEPAIADHLFKVRVCRERPAAYVPHLLFCKHEHGENLFFRSEHPRLFQKVYAAGVRALREVEAESPDAPADTRVPRALWERAGYSWRQGEFRIAMWFAAQAMRHLNARTLARKVRGKFGI